MFGFIKTVFIAAMTFFSLNLLNLNSLELCRLSVTVCNSKQIWKDDKCRFECRKDLVDRIVCDKGFSWNPSNCECECDKSC